MWVFIENSRLLVREETAHVIIDVFDQIRRSLTNVLKSTGYVMQRQV